MGLVLHPGGAPAVREQQEQELVLQGILCEAVRLGNVEMVTALVKMFASRSNNPHQVILRRNAPHQGILKSNTLYQVILKKQHACIKWLYHTA